MKIVILGTSYPYRGGIAAFTDRLATEFVKKDVDIEVVTFKLQYPSFLFPGKTQYSDAKAPEGFPISRKINSINPLSWIKVWKEIREARHCDFHLLDVVLCAVFRQDCQSDKKESTYKMYRVDSQYDTA